MLRGTRENRSFRALTLNYAGMAVLCFLLLASTIVAVIPQINLTPSTLAPAAYAQETDTGEAEETDTGEAEETDTGEAEETDTGEAEETDTGEAEQEVNTEETTPTEIFTTLETLVEESGITTTSGLQQLVAANTTDELAQMAGRSDAQELEETPGITDSQAVDAIAGAPDLQSLADLVLMSVQEMLTELLPQQPPGDEEVPPPGDEEVPPPGDEEVPPPGDEEVPPPGDEEVPPTTDLTAEISSNATSGDAPLAIEFDATIAGGTEPYTISWDFDGDGSEDSDEQNVVHTFEESGTYNVTLTVTDSDDQTVSDNLEITVEEGDEEVPPGEEVPPPGEEVPPGGGTDPFGIDELYATASGGPTWYISEEEDPTSDGHFYLSMYSGTTISYPESGVWNVDATSGTQEHGIRMHVDSPSGSWTNTEMTGYFRAVSGSDQFTMIARHGPSYHDDNGCQAYGYYGMTAIDGNVFFKKKLYHFNDGYTKRLAQVDALSSLGDNRWIGMKFVVYDLPNGDVKLELWIDDGDMTNNWRKVTELVDSGNHAVEGGDDCGRQATDTIDSGTRVTYRVDNMEFDFKKLSSREIQPPNDGESAESAAVAAAEPQDEESAAGTAAAAEPQDEETSSSEEPQGDEQTESSDEQQQSSADEILSNLQGSLGLRGIAFPT
jgi:PKD repeat protein